MRTRNQNNRDLLTVQEVADVLRIHPVTIRLWLRDGRLRGVKVGKAWRVRVSQLDAFLRAAS